MLQYGVREICDVVLKTKSTTTIGSKKFYKDEPVILFDTLKTSSLEGSSSTIYAQGGKGNPRLVSWDGDRTLTFTMEDALISPEGLMILTGAGLIEASADNKIKQHIIESIDKEDLTYAAASGDDPASVTITLENVPFLSSDENYAYVMFVKSNGDMSEPYIPDVTTVSGNTKGIIVKSHTGYTATDLADAYANCDHIIVDYYTEKSGGLRQIEIEAGKFGGSFYLEASTLFRDADNVDHAAEFIIPNCRIQSNFSFSMSGSGDPSTFTFTLDAFPGYTRFDHSKKVLAMIQVIEDAETVEEETRSATNAA